MCTSQVCPSAKAQRAQGQPTLDDVFLLSLPSPPHLQVSQGWFGLCSQGTALPCGVCISTSMISVMHLMICIKHQEV